MSTLIPFEDSDGPWFGPRQRARECLASREQVLDKKATLRVLQTILGSAAVDVEYARFIDYVHRHNEPFRYTIMLLWTAPNPGLRQDLYERASEIVEATGWYPLVQGQRVYSRQALRRFEKVLHSQVNRSALPADLRGRPRWVSDAVEGNHRGSAIRIGLRRGSLLFDTGRPGDLKPKSSDLAVALSHFHRDHSGGISDSVLRTRPLILSRATAQMLHGMGRLSTQDLRKRVILLDYDVPLNLGQDAALKAFAVPHCPGSVGYELKHPEVAIFYTGDLALGSARHDFLTKLRDRVASSGSDRRLVLLDATMADREEGASAAQAAKALFEAAYSYTDIVVVADEAAQLLYAYLDLFWYARKHPNYCSSTAFVLSDRLQKVFRVLHAAFIARRMDQLDPFLLSQYGSSMSAWAESRWLYWMSAGHPLERGHEEQLRIWLVSERELAHEHPAGRSALVKVGRKREDKWRVPRGVENLHIDGSPWTLHSNESSLARAVATLSEVAEVMLFHNSPQRSKRFLQRYRLRGLVLPKNPYIL